MLRALLVEDSKNDYELIARALHGVASVKRVSDRNGLAVALQNPGDFDLILADFSLADLDGREIIEMAKHACPDKPVIIVSGTITEKTAIEIVQAGAKDYVMKDRRPGVDEMGLLRLPVAVKRAWDERQLKLKLARHQRMEYMATTAAAVAHDLNNVFHPIGAGIHLLRTVKMPEPERDKIFKTIADAAERGAQLVKQMVRFAKGANGHKKGVKLEPLMREVVDFLNLKDQRIKIEIDVSPNLPPLTGDTVQLHQVLMNLCTNARDAMPAAGDLLIDARVVQLKDFRPLSSRMEVTGDFVCVNVSDTGIGMTAEVIAKIFDPYFSTKGEHGSGLGLSIVASIMDDHGGFIDVQSKPGFGSTFALYFPYEPPTTEKGPTGAGRTILLVDDETSILDINAAFLESSDYRVLSSPNGVGALRLLEQHGHDIRVLLADMVMPLMDGRELVQRARQIKPELRVILMSGMVDDTALKESKPDAILKKPFQPDELLLLLDQFA